LRLDAEFPGGEEAETALQSVLGAMVQRLTPNEANDLIAQLPSLLQPALRALPPGPMKEIDRASIEAELCRRLNVEPPRAGHILETVGALIAQQVSAGQIQDMQSQLPESLREVLSPVAAGRP
jgi:uncharacterized protein (DUF2267 family)